MNRLRLITTKKVTPLSDKIIIVHFISSLRRGGRERQLAAIVSACSDSKYKHQILYLNHSKDSYITEYGLEKNLLKIHSRGFFKRLQELNIILKKNNPVIVYTWGRLESIMLFLIKPLHCFKFINGSIRHGIRAKKVSHYIRTLIVHLCRYVVANSYAGLYANNLKPRKNRFVLYNGVDNKFLNFLTASDVIKKRSQLIPGYRFEKTYVFITVANLVPYKDYDTVLKALKQIADKLSYYYIIIGDGPLRHKITQVIKDYGLENRVFLAGRVENVSEYLFISDIMIHSSRGEGISNAILEGMYAGLPVIATNVGGIPETVYPESSMLFPYKDVNALVDCLLKIPEKFTGFDKNSEAYKKHLAKFSVETMVQRFEEIIEQVINDE
ncbi:MAG: glycosyltransferase [Candidatus Atribacteria bacterium]|nr:glycosyltransferase [Candidatus Atribacteria bacterium]